MSMTTWMAVVLTVLCRLDEGFADPVHSSAYIAGWNSPYLTAPVVTATTTARTGSTNHKNDGEDGRTAPEKCPSSFPIGSNHNLQKSIHTSPVIFACGSSTYLLVSTDYEELEVLRLHHPYHHHHENFAGETDNNEWLEVLFPLYLHDVNMVHTSPFAYDINKDGQDDIIVSTYNGQLIFVLLEPSSSSIQAPKKYVLPSLNVRTNWVSMYQQKKQTNDKDDDDDEALTSFFVKPTRNNYGMGGDDDDEIIVLSANPLHQSLEEYQTIQQLKKKDQKIQSDQYYYNDDAFQYQHDDPTQIMEYYEKLYKSQVMTTQDEDFIDIPPHMLSNPTYFEEPKHYDSSSYDRFHFDAYLAIAVSYYFDPDTDTKIPDPIRNTTENYVASALVLFHIPSSSFTHTLHLELSTDYSSRHDKHQVDEHHSMIAMAGASPTVADIDDNGYMDILVGTSMGRIYAYHITQPNQLKSSWNRDRQLQMKFPIERPILVEHVKKDEPHLQIFVLDNGLNVLCLNHEGNVLWSSNLLSTSSSVSRVSQLSGMVMGDVDGDGTLDLVVTATLLIGTKADIEVTRIYAIKATDGAFLPSYPMDISTMMTKDYDLSSSFMVGKIPDPLLVDLHGQKNKNKKKQQHGGIGEGLHIVQPLGAKLFIIEASTTCIQSVDLGDELSAPIKVVYNNINDNLELLVTTESGNILTLQVSNQVPYHPLNVIQQSSSSSSHGYSSSSGIFLHPKSRESFQQHVSGNFIDFSFEIFDRRNRNNTSTMNPQQKYFVEVRHGSRVYFRKIYNTTGLFSEQLYIPHGPGYYTLCLHMKTSHGILYRDSFPIAYNVETENTVKNILYNLILLPLFLAAIPIFSYQHKYDNFNQKQGILDASSTVTKKPYTYIGRH